jgi:hypothetical protein
VGREIYFQNPMKSRPRAKNNQANWAVPHTAELAFQCETMKLVQFFGLANVLQCLIPLEYHSFADAAIKEQLICALLQKGVGSVEGGGGGTGEERVT